MTKAVSLALVLALALCACKRADQGGAESADEPEPKVILYGFDPDVPKKAPESCKRLGKIEASSIGEKSFPEGALRNAALDKGGNGVTGIRKDGMEDVFVGTKVHFKGQAVRCPDAPSGPAPAKVAPGAAESDTPSDAAPSK